MRHVVTATWRRKSKRVWSGESTPIKCPLGPDNPTRLVRHRPHQLNGGEQQRIAVVRAFVTAPRFIFADEPTGNLDIHTSESIAELMFLCAREAACGLVIVTHSDRLATRADTSLMLSKGLLEVSA